MHVAVLLHPHCRAPAAPVHCPHRVRAVRTLHHCVVKNDSGGTYSLIGADTAVAVSFKHLILPQLHPRHTELLDLQPLPITALKDKRVEALYTHSHFNPVQVSGMSVAYIVVTAFS